MISFSTSEREEIFVGLQFVESQLENALLTPASWKWAIMGLDNVLQNVFVTCIRDSVGSNILANQKKWLSAFEKFVADGKTQMPEERLSYFDDLYKAVKDQEQMQRFVHSKPYEPMGTEERSIEQLHGYRNSFVHFIPRIWRIHCGIFPPLFRDVCKAIEFLLFESGNFPWYSGSDDSVTVKGCLARIETLLQKHEEADRRK